MKNAIKWSEIDHQGAVRRLEQFSVKSKKRFKEPGFNPITLFSVKIQTIGGKVYISCKGKTLLGVDITQQCFALLANFPANNFHRGQWWWDRIQAIVLNLFYFTKYHTWFGIYRDPFPFDSRIFSKHPEILGIPSIRILRDFWDFGILNPTYLPDLGSTGIHSHLIAESFKCIPKSLEWGFCRISGISESWTPP